MAEIPTTSLDGFPPDEFRSRLAVHDKEVGRRTRLFRIAAALILLDFRWPVDWKLAAGVKCHETASRGGAQSHGEIRHAEVGQILAGEIAEIVARVGATGRSSMVVEAELWAENHTTAIAVPAALAVSSWWRWMRTTAPFQFRPQLGGMSLSLRDAEPRTIPTGAVLVGDLLLREREGKLRAEGQSQVSAPPF